jgi:hypothetical protein
MPPVVKTQKVKNNFLPVIGGCIARHANVMLSQTSQKKIHDPIASLCGKMNLLGDPKA